MVDDRRTAKILGLVVLLFTLLVDASMLMFAPASARARAGFPVVVLLSSTPFFALSAWLMARGGRAGGEGTED